MSALYSVVFMYYCNLVLPGDCNHFVVLGSVEKDSLFFLSLFITLTLDTGYSIIGRHFSGVKCFLR